jgi:hypothetical protein
MLHIWLLLREGALVPQLGGAVHHVVLGLVRDGDLPTRFRPH